MNDQTQKLGFFASMPDMASGTVPSEFQVFPRGRISVAGGDPFYVDDTAISTVISAFQSRGLDMVIDYEHQTEGGDFASPDGKAPAAGWIKSLEARSDGLYAKVEWTERAVELLSRKEYRYFSPVFLVSKGARRLVELLRVALTNAPRLNWIKPIVAKNANSTEGEIEMEFLKLIAKQLGLPETATQEEVTAKLTEVLAAGPMLLKNCATAAGIAEASTSEQLIASLKTLPAQAAELKEVRTALGLPEASGKSEVIASIHALKQRPGSDVVQELAALKARLAGREASELVEAALKAGKITPAQKEWAEKYATDDAEGFKLFVAKAPQVVPVGTTQVLSDKPGKEALDDAQLQINKMMGIDEETFKKYNK